MITFGGMLFVILFAVLGAWRGALRFVAAFGALLAASLLASPLHFLTGWMVAMTGAVPRIMLPLAGTLTTGIAFFLLFIIPLELMIRKRERARAEAELSPREPWQSYLGGVLGGAWGFVLLFIICLGIATIARVDRAMRTAHAEIEYRADRRQKEQKRAQRLARMTYSKAPEVNMSIELAPIPKDLKVAEPPDTRIEAFNKEVERSVFAPLVEKASPVDGHREELLKDLAVVVGDPVLFDRFQSHPKIIELAADSRFQDLSKDPQIAEDVRAGKFRELLDNEKICALAQDQDLRKQLEALQIDNILKKVKGGQ